MVARTAPAGAPFPASSKSRAPMPRPCASGSTKRLLRNHQSPRSSPELQATIPRPAPSPAAASATQQPLAVVAQEVLVHRGYWSFSSGTGVWPAGTRYPLRAARYTSKSARQIRLPRVPVRDPSGSRRILHGR